MLTTGAEIRLRFRFYRASKARLHEISYFSGNVLGERNTDQLQTPLEISSSAPLLAFAEANDSMDRDSNTSYQTDWAILKEMLNSNILITLPESTS